MKVLPESFLKCMRPEDRAELGRAGRTQEEADARAVARSEKELQGQIVQYLRMRGIEPLWHRTDKKSHATVGWPDITFAVIGQNGHDGSSRIYACAFEVKLPGRHLDETQRKMRQTLTSHPNHWTHRTVCSVAQVSEFLNGIGLL